MCKTIENMVIEAAFETLLSLLRKNKITLDDALEVSPDKEAFMKYLLANNYKEANG